MRDGLGFEGVMNDEDLNGIGVVKMLWLAFIKRTKRVLAKKLGFEKDCNQTRCVATMADNVIPFSF